MDIQTPGLYGEETSASPSIQPTATCLPLFIGYTEKTPWDDQTALTDYTGSFERLTIHSLAEYHHYFGQQKINILQFSSNAFGQTTSLHIESPFYLDSCLQLFFENGGRVCEVLSLGHFPTTPDVQDFISAIEQLPAQPIFTMIAIPDAASLYQLPLIQQQLLAYCQQQNHCFAILDVPFCTAGSFESTIDNFRKQIGNENLRHGAAFLPWLTVTETIKPQMLSEAPIQFRAKTPLKFRPHSSTLTQQKFPLRQPTVISSQIDKIHKTIPPCGVIMAIFQNSDRNLGIWRAPSSHALFGIQSLSIQISDHQQNYLTHSVELGKIINPIREFTGRGIQLWGARTLAGHNDEWRYISIVRTAGFIKASLENHLDNMDFTRYPNEPNTWLLIKGLVEKFLHTLWRESAFRGTQPSDAFYIRIGLHETMTNVDVDEGRLRIEMGLAFLRPAEFTLIVIEKIMVSPIILDDEAPL